MTMWYVAAWLIPVAGVLGWLAVFTPERIARQRMPYVGRHRGN